MFLVHRKAPQTIAAQYDEAIRRQWADFAANNVPSFDVNKAALAVDREVLRRLESVSFGAIVRPAISSCILCTCSGGVCGFHTQSGKENRQQRDDWGKRPRDDASDA